jgi:myo-inositol-1-phosphate synthase
MGRIRLGKRTDNREPFLHEFVPLAGLDDLVFGGWDLFPDDAYAAARNAEVLTRDHLDSIKDELSAVKPMSAVFFPEFVKRLRGEHVKRETNKMELAEAVREDVRGFKLKHGLTRCVAVWCGSTEVHHEPK